MIKKLTSLFGAALLIAVAAIDAAATTHVWSGAGANKLFSNPANWSSGGVPTTYNTNQHLVFPTNCADTAIVDINNVRFTSVEMKRDNLKLSGTNGASMLLINEYVATYGNVPAAGEVRVQGTNFVVASSLTLVLSNEWTFSLGRVEYDYYYGYYLDDAGSVQLACAVTGTGNLVLNGWGNAEIAGTQPNTYAGLTYVGTDVVLSLNKTSGITAIPGDLNIAGWVYLNNANQIANTAALKIYGTLDLNGFNETVGDITMPGGDIHGTNGVLSMNGNFSGSGNIYTKINLGVPYRGSRIVECTDDLNMRNEISGPSSTILRKTGTGTLNILTDNTYGGRTEIVEGVVSIRTDYPFGASSNGTVVLAEGEIYVLDSVALTEPLVLMGSTNTNIYQVLPHIAINDGWGTTLSLGGLITISNNVKLYVPYSTTNYWGFLNISSPIGGPGTLSKSGGGTMRFSGASGNTFTGGMHVYDGKVELQRVNGAISVPSSLHVHGDDVWGGQVLVVSSIQNQIADTADIYVDGTGVLYFDNVHETVHDLNFEGGWIGSGSGILTVNGKITSAPSWDLAYIAGTLNLGSTPKTFDIGAGESSPDFAVYATVTGSAFASLTKQGAGSLALYASNSFQGSVYVNEGALTVKHPQALGTTFGSTIVSSNSAVEIETLAALPNESLSLVAGTLRFLPANATNTWTGPISLGADNAIEVTDPYSTLRLTNAISGGGGFTKRGFGTLEIAGSAPNTYFGGTLVENGVMNVKKPSGIQAISGSDLRIIPQQNPVNPPIVNLYAMNVISDACALVVKSGGTLRLNNWSDVVGSLSGDGSVDLSNGILRIGANNVSTEFSGVISGPAGLIYKVGSGTLTLSGTNTYGANTLIEGGTLAVNGQLAGAVNVNSNAVLTGKGRVTSLGVTQGKVAPGAGVGRLTASNPSFNAQTVLAFELNGTTPGVNADVIEAIGTVNLGGATLNATLGFAGGVSNQFVLISNDGTDAVNGTFAGLPEGGTLTLNGAQFKITYKGGSSSNDVVLTQMSVATPPKSSGITKLPNGQMQVGGEGVAGMVYEVQANTNLSTTNWVVIGSSTANQSGAFSFIDTNAPNYPIRFYRFVIP